MEDKAYPLQGDATKKVPLLAWVSLFVFLLYFIMSFIDRTVINMMVEPIEHDLALSDFQISILLGPAFSMTYLIFCLPMGYLVDKFRTRPLLFSGVSLWGASTIGCGITTGFLPFAAARMGVGIGEAVLTPAAHATIAQQFPRQRLAFAMSVYTLGSSIGGGLALALGGVVVHLAGQSGTRMVLPIVGEIHAWQAVFLMVGAITLIMLPLLFLVGNASGAAHHLAHPTKEESSEPFGQTFRRHWRYFVMLPLGYAMINVINSAYSAWVPTFMIRTYGWNAAETGLAWGTQHLVAISTGLILNSIIVDRMFARGVTDAHARYPIIALIVSTPLLVLAFLLGNAWAFLVLTGVFYTVAIPFVGYAGAAMQLFTPTRWRGRMSGFLTAILVGIGPSFGAPLVGVLSDTVFGKQHLAASLLVVTLVVVPVALLFLAIAGREMKRLQVARLGTSAG